MTSKVPRRPRSGPSSNPPSTLPMALPTRNTQVTDEKAVEPHKFARIDDEDEPLVLKPSVIPRTKPRTDEICRKFLRGQCLRGAKCPHLHVRPMTEGQGSSSSLPSGVSERIVEVSKFARIDAEHEPPVLKPSVITRTKPRTDEICLKFLRGQCLRGAKCPRLHVRPMTEGQGSSSLPNCVNESIVDVPKFARIVDEHEPPVLKPGGRFDAGPTVDEFCSLFLENRCPDGKRCRYLHARPTTEGRGSSLNPLTPPGLPARKNNVAHENQNVVDALQLVPPRFRSCTMDEYVVKLPNQYFWSGNDQTTSCSSMAQISCSNDSTHDSNLPIGRLRRPHCPPGPNHDDIHNIDKLSFDEETSFSGWKSDDAVWANTSVSSDESLSSSSTMSTTATSASQLSTGPNPSHTRIKHPPPPFPEVCRRWLRDQCTLGYNCRWVHRDLDYDFPDSSTSRPRPAPPPPPEPHLSIMVHDHTRVRLGSGFEIHEVTTSVETPWLVLSNVPVRVKPNAISQLLAPFGSVVDLKIPPTPAKDVMTVKARFSTHAEALRASTALDGSAVFKTTISARIPVNSRSGMVDIQDSTVRIQWEAPSKVAYGGYPSPERAQEAIAAARTPCEDYYVHASIHVGLPSIGAVTVKFANLPPTADEKCMERFARPEDIMWERPNYLVLSLAVDGVKRTLHSLGNLRELDVLPPPYLNGLVRAWATFSSSAAARSAAASIHGRKPIWTGKTRIFARYVQTLAYHISLEAYEKDAPLINALREAAFRNGCGMTVAVRRLPMSMLIRLSAEGNKALGWLKAEFEKMSQGEILRRDGVAIWDSFFGRPNGAEYLRTVSAEEPGVRIEVNSVQRLLRLFGTPRQRAAVGTILLQKMDELKARRVRVIRVHGRVVSAFIPAHLTRLCDKFGAENIHVDIWERTITLRGDDALYEAAVEAIHQIQQSSLARLTYRPNIIECPVCFNQVVSRITLRCGHTWCRACLTQYFLAAIDNRRFPLKCLGDEAKCTECIPLSAARGILQPAQFNSIVDAALSSYVHAHAKELHYCPSPDCLQIYRTGPKGTVVQCPACLLRICPHCHAEAHDGFDCADRDGGDRLFKEWAASHDVKNCPGCAIPIERDEGCHHVTCIHCQTHICWVCLQTFPKGEGIYKHMRTVHGGIGLGQEY